MRVIIREAAYDDLDRIYAWIAKDRPRSAAAVIDRVSCHERSLQEGGSEAGNDV